VEHHDAPLSDRLQALALASVTVTAAIDASGHLHPVGGLWPKLLVAAKEAAIVGLLRTIVVAAEQADIPSELEQETASPLRVLRAVMDEETRTRAATITLWDYVASAVKGPQANLKTGAFVQGCYFPLLVQEGLT
jgi:hypothetical protein